MTIFAKVYLDENVDILVEENELSYYYLSRKKCL